MKKYWIFFLEREREREREKERERERKRESYNWETKSIEKMEKKNSTWEKKIPLFETPWTELQMT